MTSEQHDALRVSLGVYAMNKADSRERQTIREHLDRCSSCQDELADLLAIVDLLDRTALRPRPITG
ncbi:MAG: zf-HC2 domain-containing protein [Actinophytocola sp.]|uniref:zf-HC2 domain-containing protein n=1 Tax=Actinophytocola sp. TaxID=1872138 RepID=UPI003D6B8CD6